MENKLRKLFDFQRFQMNERLQTMIEHAQYSYNNSALEDDDLCTVAAAGEQFTGERTKL